MPRSRARIWADVLNDSPLTDDHTGNLTVSGTVTASSFSGDGSSLTGIESLPAAIDVNGSAPVDSLAIDASGEVGIGTTSPARNLEISSTGPAIRLTDNNSTGSAMSGFVEWYDSTTTATALIGFPSTTNADFSVSNYITGGDLKFNTETTTRMRIDNSGHVTPGANGTQDFGSTSLRWANIYTSDLHLNNGIGDYTVVEGEEDLFLYNNKNGKTYKFLLAEVDPKDAPKKMEK